MKREIWHRAVERIIQSMIPYSEVGYSLMCGDGVYQHVYPHISVLSADYEEMLVHSTIFGISIVLIRFDRCMMALTHGVNAKAPCPVCLVPDDELSMLSETYTLRTTESMQEVWNFAWELPSRTARDNYLRQYGLREVRVNILFM